MRPRAQGRALLEVAKDFAKGGFLPARRVMLEVFAVPTCFVQFDHAVRVGGYPTERFSLVHGPSNEGKTAFVLGLIKSFLAAGGLALYIDAERTTPITWVAQLMGVLADHPFFFAHKPTTYEATIEHVRVFLNLLANLRAKGKIAKNAKAIVVCDSLRKLVPAGLMDEIIKNEKELAKPGKKITAGRDRAGQIRGKMNAAWMDELVPLLDHAGAAFVAIGREMVDPDNTNDWAKKAGNNYKIGGGGAIYFDSSLVARVQRWGWVQQKRGENEAPDVYGERHRVTIKKTKVGGKDGKVTDCAFFTSNGRLIPLGFDRARDVLELGERFEVVEKGNKGWLLWRDEAWNGMHKATVDLSAAPTLLAELEAEVRAKFKEHKPVEYDDETGEVEG